MRLRPGISELRRALAKAYPRAEEDNIVRGRLGQQNADGTYTFEVDEEEPGRVLVTLDDGTVTQAIHDAGPRVGGLDVRMVERDGELIVIGVDSVKAREWMGDASQAISPSTPYHHHNDPSLWDDVGLRRFLPGQVHVSSGMVVAIEPFFYPYAGTDVYYPGGTLDLSAYQPITADTWSWVKVGVDPATNTSIGMAGAEFSDLVPLGPELLEDIDFAAYITCGAVRVMQDDTVIGSEERFAGGDCRMVLGGGAGIADDRYVQLSLFDANTFLAANSDNTPVAVSVPTQTLLGRKTGGNIAALTVPEVVTLLGIVVHDGQVVCTDSEIVTA